MSTAESAPAPAGGEREVRPEFTGSAREYFRIWIVNLFFTLATLGIYSAWAKVRKKRYFYGSTRFDGDTFDYFGSPKTILRGRLNAAVVLVVYLFVTEIYPEARFVFWGLLALALPWMVLRGLAFNARNSAFRGVRFDFTGKAGEAARVYLGRLLLVAVTLGIYFPWFMARQKSFTVSCHGFGTSGFRCSLPGRDFFRIYFVAGLIVGLISAPLGFAASALAEAQPLPADFEWLAFGVGTVGLYTSYAVAHAYVQAHAGNLQWSLTTAPGLRFASTLSAASLTKLYVGNLTAIACSAGLLIPWAVVRTLRYRLENITVYVTESVVHQANPALPAVGATGQELGDLFDVGIGV